MEMKFRSNFFPRKIASKGAFIFIMLIIPIIYWFELFVVLPALFEMWTIQYWAHFVFGHFLGINVLGSYIGLIVIDNSVKKHINDEDIQTDWRFCDKCNIQVPPRSWHCTVCDDCMLKRDHHCIFTGYCIGHHNHRYFIMFLFYMALGGLYGTFYNCYFFGSQLSPSKMLLRMIFSLPLLLNSGKIDITLIYLFIFQFIIGGSIYLIFLLVYHMHLLINGCVGHENKCNIVSYNMGKMKNFIAVFGERWYLSWLSPFIHSELPNNGFSWNINLEPKKMQ